MHRWAVLEAPGSKGVHEFGRVRRLFATGHKQEERMVADLRRIGCEVTDRDGTGAQWSVRMLSGHFGGSMDAIVRGLPEAPRAWHLAEFKTHNDKSFTDLAKDGVRASKPEHYAQMQVYMGKADLQRALYMAVNKNNDDLYIERVDFNATEFERLLKKAEGILRATEPPPRIGKADYFVCKFCDFSDVCHGSAIPEVHCRTCAHATPVLDGIERADGNWSCARDPELRPIPFDVQKVGCGGHRFIPILLERHGTAVSGDADTVHYRSSDGSEWANGDGAGGTLTSHEIVATHGLVAEVAIIKRQAVARGFPGAKVVE